MANIYICDELDPEATAMLQALYSRSSNSVREHINKVKSEGTRKFMENYYIGYGHSSIGDCGNTTLFIEGISILACKAIQDNPLYSGQETSTRYIDFSKQILIDPINNQESKKIMRNWISFYELATMPLITYLKEIHPLHDGQKENVWKKAIKARGFDILRGFLPAGVTTQLSWNTSLRQAYEKLNSLKYHPLREVREIAIQCLDILRAKYPSSFSHKKNQEQEEYLKKNALASNYLIQDDNDLRDKEFYYETTVSNDELEAGDLDVIMYRPAKINLPRYLGKYGHYKCTFPLDYGSFRDLQRHRNGLCQIPLLNDLLGFHSWYLEQLPIFLKQKAIELIDQQYKAIKELAPNKPNKEDLQYYYPLGTKVTCKILYDLPQMVYVTELRSGKTVHPTLRKITHKMHATLKKEHPKLKLYTNLSEDVWDIRRGLQDIEKINF